MLYAQNNDAGMHIDVYDENFDGHDMEFWMPVIEASKED